MVQLALQKELLKALDQKASKASIILEREVPLGEFIDMCLWYANLHYESVIKQYQQTLGNSIVVKS